MLMGELTTKHSREWVKDTEANAQSMAKQKLAHPSTAEKMALAIREVVGKLETSQI